MCQSACGIIHHTIEALIFRPCVSFHTWERAFVCFSVKCMILEQSRSWVPFVYYDVRSKGVLRLECTCEPLGWSICGNLKYCTVSNDLYILFCLSFSLLGIIFKFKAAIRKRKVDGKPFVKVIVQLLKPFQARRKRRHFVRQSTNMAWSASLSMSNYFFTRITYCSSGKMWLSNLVVR